MNDIKQQLAPGWSTVNVVIAIMLFLISWPLAALFVAYILWGGKVGLDLSRPETISAFGVRIATAFKAGIDTFKKS